MDFNNSFIQVGILFYYKLTNTENKRNEMTLLSILIFSLMNLFIIKIRQLHPLSTNRTKFRNLRNERNFFLQDQNHAMALAGFKMLYEFHETSEGAKDSL